MQDPKLQLKIKNYPKVLILVLGILLILSLAGNVWLIQKDKLYKVSGGHFTSSVGSSLVKSVSASEIYPLFECPCCGKSIDQCTCPMAKERKNYVDALIEITDNQSKDDIILAYVKKYGLDSFLDTQKQKEFREKLVKEAPVDRPMISLNPDSYDFVDVSQKGGKVFTYFEIKNEGESDLVIDRLSTSCGCTFASIVFRGEEGPLFTMPSHGYENPEWEGVSIPSGETAQLKILYDPDVHKDFRGPAIREIYVFSNDPIDFEKKVQIELNQVD